MTPGVFLTKVRRWVESEPALLVPILVSPMTPGHRGGTTAPSIAFEGLEEFCVFSENLRQRGGARASPDLKFE